MVFKKPILYPKNDSHYNLTGLLVPKYPPLSIGEKSDISECV